MITMEQKENENKPVSTNCKLSSKASAFSIAAIIGEQSLSRASDNVSPSVDDSDNDSVKDDALSTSESSAFHSVKSDDEVEPSCSKALAGAKCKLETKDLWLKFHELGTEMIITKSGRRMFPTLRVSFSGLEATSRYIVMMDIVPVDKKRYRYAYHRSSWLVAGKADPPPKSRLYMHPDAVFSGEQLQKQTVSFEKLKLTNNVMDKNGQIVLNSMHKYQPRVHLVKLSDNTPTPVTTLEGEDHRTFVFSESTFIAVTAYQNQLITKLKIDSNPFAKGFRDSSRLSEFERETMEGMLQTHSYARSPLRSFSDPEYEEASKSLEESQNKVYPENVPAWRPIPTTIPTSLPTTIPTSLPFANGDLSFFSVYGSMLSSHPLYSATNHELLLRNHLYKGHLQASALSGMHAKHLQRHHPYLPVEKLREARC